MKNLNQMKRIEIEIKGFKELIEHLKTQMYKRESPLA
jgi:hypothetical protein